MNRIIAAKTLLKWGRFVRLVAVRGAVNDWAVYGAYNDTTDPVEPDCWIAAHGFKLTTFEASRDFPELNAATYRR